MMYLARLYKFVSFALFAVEVLMVLLIIISLVTRGRIVQYFGEKKEVIDNYDFNQVIPFGEVMIMTLATLWILLTVVLLIDVRLPFKSTPFFVGVIGFIAAIVYIGLDPFGYGRYYFD